MESRIPPADDDDDDEEEARLDSISLLSFLFFLLFLLALLRRCLLEISPLPRLGASLDPPKMLNKPRRRCPIPPPQRLQTRDGNEFARTHLPADDAAATTRAVDGTDSEVDSDPGPMIPSLLLTTEPSRPGVYTSWSHTVLWYVYRRVASQ